jgi:phosphoribosylglycinamide formyltransferase-1
VSAGQRVRLGVLGSGKGSNLSAIFQAIGEKRLPAEVRVVVSDVPDAGIIGIARAHGVRAEYVPPGNSFRARLSPESERRIVDLLDAEGVDLVVLAGFMRIIGAPLLAAFSRRMINIHPSLLPRHPGLHAWRQALQAGDSVTGCTVHYVDAGVDTGEIIAQSEVEVLSDDTAESLHARIQAAEHALYPEVIARWARNRSFAE